MEGAGLQSLSLIFEMNGDELRSQNLKFDVDEPCFKAGTRQNEILSFGVGASLKKICGSDILFFTKRIIHCRHLIFD